MRIASAQLDDIERIAQGGPILVAFSGGGDSTALLHLLIDALGRERLRVAIVDHALRDGSALDAQLACERALALGVAAEILTLTWPDGPKRAQAAARAARYRALSSAARKQDCRVIAVGHTADDQAETIAMRAEAGSSWRGLAGMRTLSPAPIWPEGRALWLARPLLDARREALRELLQARGAEWIEDPANANPDFARVRMRAALAAQEREGLDPMRFCAEAAAHQSRALELDRAARDLIVASAHCEAGDIRLDPAAWAGFAAEVQIRALGVLIAAAAGAEREADASGLSDQLSKADFAGAALGGATLKKSGASILIRRDLGALLGRADGAKPLAPADLEVGTALVWDGRLEINALQPSWWVQPGADGAPVFRRGDTALSLAEAADAGALTAEWQTKTQIDHLLPVECVGVHPLLTPVVPLRGVHQGRPLLSS